MSDRTWLGELLHKISVWIAWHMPRDLVYMATIKMFDSASECTGVSMSEIGLDRALGEWTKKSSSRTR